MASADTISVAVAGAGAFGRRHLDALAVIPGVEVAAVVDPSGELAQRVASEYGIDSSATALDDVLARDDVDAVILATPTPLHASQAIACLEAGKHVEVEIPLCDDSPMARPCSTRSSAPASSPCAATPAASTRATSGSTDASRTASW